MALKALSHLLDYRHKKINDKLYIGGLRVTVCRRRKGLVPESKLLVVAPPKEVVLLVASPLRRTSTRVTSCYIS